MLISVAPPPLPPTIGQFDEVATLCTLCPSRGLSGDPFGITDVLGLVSNYFQSKSQEKIAKKQISVEQQQLKEQKAEAARAFAQSQAQDLSQPATQTRQQQIIVLTAVGGAAVLIAGLLIFGAIKQKKGV